MGSGFFRGFLASKFVFRVDPVIAFRFEYSERPDWPRITRIDG
jgi:hypothetical protein